MDSFKWCTQIQGGAAKVAISNNIRSIVFGNGYIQTASIGINTKRRTVPIVYGGSDWEEVYNFCQDHVT
ncbi:phage tail protein, partial [Klebsiella pneumoniae]|nr:phage tail protein [Klebsiella pneumoniae]